MAIVINCICLVLCFRYLQDTPPRRAARYGLAIGVFCFLLNVADSTLGPMEHRGTQAIIEFALYAVSGPVVFYWYAWVESILVHLAIIGVGAVWMLFGVPIVTSLAADAVYRSPT
jgi:hypothetical protein